jgi:hypothetical protein
MPRRRSSKSEGEEDSDSEDEKDKKRRARLRNMSALNVAGTTVSPQELERLNAKRATVTGHAESRIKTQKLNQAAPTAEGREPFKGVRMRKGKARTALARPDVAQSEDEGRKRRGKGDRALEAELKAERRLKTIRRSFVNKAPAVERSSQQHLYRDSDSDIEATRKFHEQFMRQPTNVSRTAESDTDPEGGVTATDIGGEPLAGGSSSETEAFVGNNRISRKEAAQIDLARTLADRIAEDTRPVAQADLEASVERQEQEKADRKLAEILDKMGEEHKREPTPRPSMLMYEAPVSRLDEAKKEVDAAHKKATEEKKRVTRTGGTEDTRRRAQEELARQEQLKRVLEEVELRNRKEKEKEAENDLARKQDLARALAGLRRGESALGGSLLIPIESMRRDLPLHGENDMVDTPAAGDPALAAQEQAVEDMDVRDAKQAKEIARLLADTLLPEEPEKATRVIHVPGETVRIPVPVPVPVPGPTVHVPHLVEVAASGSSSKKPLPKSSSKHGGGKRRTTAFEENKRLKPGAPPPPPPPVPPPVPDVLPEEPHVPPAPGPVPTIVPLVVPGPAPPPPPPPGPPPVPGLLPEEPVVPPPMPPAPAVIPLVIPGPAPPPPPPPPPAPGLDDDVPMPPSPVHPSPPRRSPSPPRRSPSPRFSSRHRHNGGGGGGGYLLPNLTKAEKKAINKRLKRLANERLGRAVPSQEPVSVARPIVIARPVVEQQARPPSPPPPATRYYISHQHEVDSSRPPEIPGGQPCAYGRPRIVTNTTTTSY